MRLSHKSTVCIIPPLAVQQAVQRVRCFKDKSFVRWPPHINLLYPFFEDRHLPLDDAASTAAQALAHMPPFKVRLSTLSFFEHSTNSYTMWMDAADTSGLVGLQSALQAAFPACTDLSDDPQRGITAFTPHLSLGQWHNKQQLLAALQEYSGDADLMGMQFDVREVCICSRQGYRDPFTVCYTIPLGSATPSAPYTSPQLVNVPYIATTTRHLPDLLGLSDSPTDKLRFGLGAAPTGLWNFAYGANMSPRKLGGSRGLHPQESKPGVLRGYELGFNHRGGFGNIVPAAAAAGAGGEESAVAAGGAGVEREVQHEVHGVLHRLEPAELADLMCMEHEYEPVVVMVEPYSNKQQQQQQVGEAAQVSGPEPQEQQQQKQQQQVSGSSASYVPQVQSQQLVPALAFQSPPDRLIRGGLPPIRRYLDLLREGARHWSLNQQYTSWLEQHSTVGDSADRGVEYYTSPQGEPLAAWAKIRTGGSQQPNNRQRGGRGGRGGRGHRGGGNRRERLV